MPTEKPKLWSRNLVEFEDALDFAISDSFETAEQVDEAIRYFEDDGWLGEALKRQREEIIQLAQSFNETKEADS